MNVLALLLVPVLSAGSQADGHRYFEITVVDSQTGRGVPLVELSTVNQVRYVTDSNGIVAFHEPGLMGRKVFFHVKSHGYEFPKNGFGIRGKALEVTAGGTARLEIIRTNIAQRLYRVTGAGIYRDSVLVGQPTPLEHPLVNAGVLGSDSVVTALYQGRLYWFWGDTSRAAFPLGNFHVTGATSQLASQGGLDPELGVDLDYFEDGQGFVKPMARMPGEGPTWIDGLVAVEDDEAGERLFASYAKIRGQLTVYARGLAEFDDEQQQFEHVAEFDLRRPLFPSGHPLKLEDDSLEEGGVQHVYFASPLPLVRVRAAADELSDLSRYEAYTCLVQGSRIAKGSDTQAQLDRDDKGRLRWGWKRDTSPLSPELQRRLIEQGVIQPAEALYALQDAATGKAVALHGGSVYWNNYRQRFVLIGLEAGGSSFLGEVWYAEAKRPLGPWVYARKVVSHDRYSFYNPKQHPEFEKEGGRLIFFEGTYANTFSGNPQQTPRYDYNQVMYKLDLGDPRLVLPVAVYAIPESDATVRWTTSPENEPVTKERVDVAFFAPDRPLPGLVPIFARQEPAGVRLVVGEARGGSGAETALFYGLPADSSDQAAATVGLYEFIEESGGRRFYSTDEVLSLDGYRRVKQPVCLVWRNPLSATW